MHHETPEPTKVLDQEQIWVWCNSKYLSFFLWQSELKKLFPVNLYKTVIIIYPCGRVHFKLEYNKTVAKLSQIKMTF